MKFPNLAVESGPQIEPVERELREHGWLPIKYVERDDDALPEVGAGFNHVVLNPEACALLGIPEESTFGYAEFLLESGYLTLGTMAWEECRQGDWDCEFHGAYALRVGPKGWEVAPK